MLKDSDMLLLKLILVFVLIWVRLVGVCVLLIMKLNFGVEMKDGLIDWFGRNLWI